jgi:hypothetical protein
VKILKKFNVNIGNILEVYAVLYVKDLLRRKMMFYILKHGNTFPYICTCEKCGCVWIFDEEDLHFIDSPSQDHYQTRCPECYTLNNKWGKDEFKRNKGD